MNAITEANFKKTYEEAKANNLMSFMFNGEEYSLGYANYLLTYELPKKRKENEENKLAQGQESKD